MVPALAIATIGFVDAALPKRLALPVVGLVVLAAAGSFLVTQPAAPWRA
jgi:hypothetical protein